MTNKNEFYQNDETQDPIIRAPKHLDFGDFNVSEFLEGEEIIWRRAKILMKNKESLENYRKLAREYEHILRYTRNNMNHLFVLLDHPEGQK